MDNISPKTKRSRELRTEMSQPEIILWGAIRRRRLGYVIKRQQPFGPYFLDFYIGKLKLAIEVDGRIHEDTVELDEKRDTWLESQGLTVIRIPARSIYERLPDVMEYLEFRIIELAGKGNEPILPQT